MTRISLVGETPAGDRITLSPADTAGGVRVQIDGADAGVYTPTGQIVVYGLGANDTIAFQTAKFGKQAG